MKTVGLIIQISLLISGSLFHSCNLDQVVNNYPDYDSAKKGGLINQGWIPARLITNSMTNIYLKTNLDRNSGLFSLIFKNPIWIVL
jgi:hypothetical protein